MAQKLSLSICHLYGDLMNTYGDNGNISAIKYRCNKRNIAIKVENITLENNLEKDFDFYFFGGGQDKTQKIVSSNLRSKSKKLKESIEKGSVMLSICGGYQLLQNYFKTKEGKIIPGIGLFDAHTEGSNDRMIQNLLIEMNPSLSQTIKSSYPTTDNRQLTTSLIGFENHSGKTYLNLGVKPLGKVISGSGNNGEDQTEGAIYKNAFGCYLHGSLLPKNPHFADYLISKALERRNGTVKLEPLDDSVEWQAHQSAVKRARSQA